MKRPTDDSIVSRRSVLKTAGASTILALAGCSGSSASAKTTTHGEAGESGEGGEDFVDESKVTALPSAPADSTTVEMTMVSATEPVFAPEVTWVTVGGSVTWKNVDEDPHTTTAYASDNGTVQRIPDGAKAWDSGTMKTGDTFSVTFDTAGVYDYYCIPHEGLGMLGTVVVGTPDTAGQPGLAAPQDSLPGKAPKKVAALNDRVTTLLSK